MSTTVGNIIDRARGLMHDRKDSNYAREFLNEQANGVITTFQVRNRNLLQVADGAPADVAALVNQVGATISTVAQDPGLATLSAAPAALSLVEFRYYFSLSNDAEWLDFYRTAAGFAGFADVQADTVATVPLYEVAMIPAVTLYCAAQASRSLASQTHWYYSANAGNKGFNKDQISRKFMEQADKWETEAKTLRSDVYTRFDQAKAPAAVYIYTGGLRPWTPPR